MPDNNYIIFLCFSQYILHINVLCKIEEKNMLKVHFVIGCGDAYHIHMFQF